MSAKIVGVGLYAAIQTVLDDPGYIDALQHDAGMNLVLLTSSYNLSQELRDSAPYMTPNGRQGAGLAWTDNDHMLREVIDVCHARGIKVWMVVGGWHGLGETYRDYCVRDLWDRPLYEVPKPRYALESSLAICPSRPEINQWMERAVAEVAHNYEVDGINITHARHTAPAYIPAWWSCACDYCQRRATAMGYDMARMRESVDAFLAGLRCLTPLDIKYLVRSQTGLFGLFQFLGIDGGVVDWFNFRADVISANLRNLHKAVHDATARDITWGSDTFPPSFALLAGHRYRDFTNGASDYTFTLISHVAFFICASLASFADVVMQCVPGLGETDALRLSYALFGFDHLQMPASIADYHIGNWDLEEASTPLASIVEKEFALARALNPGIVPSYPMIKGSLWSTETIQRLIQVAYDQGHEGILFQAGTSALSPHLPKT